MNEELLELKNRISKYYVGGWSAFCFDYWSKIPWKVKRLFLIRAAKEYNE